MSCGFLATSVRNVLGDGSHLGLRLRFVEEPEPRGTAGALKYAEDLLDERFLMLNGDVLTDIDLTAQIAQHERTGRDRDARARPRRRPDGLRPRPPERGPRGARVRREADAPTQIDTNLISAGAYVLERDVLDLIPADRNVSIEREVWPQLVGDGLYGFAGRGLLAGHRHTRALPAGHLRHPRGQRADRRRRAAGRRATWTSSRGSSRTGASCRPRSSSAAAGSTAAPTSAASSCSARA